MSSLFVALFALVASSFRTRAALQAEILALSLFKVASISHSRRGCRHADKVFGNHNSARTACALVQAALQRESDASHVDTTSAGALACTNRALMSEIQAIWVNFERKADSPNC
jgi:hypothetical protein